MEGKTKCAAGLAVITAILAVSCPQRQRDKEPEAVNAAFDLPEAAREQMIDVGETGDALTFTICSKSHPCEVPFDTVVSENGLRVRLYRPGLYPINYPLSEAPKGGKMPTNGTLTPLSFTGWRLFNLATLRDIILRSNAHISPTDPSNKFDRSDAKFSTTARRWPVVLCYDPIPASYMCSFGFLIKHVFVEATFGRHGPKWPTQREIWEIASATDAKIRDMAIPQLQPDTSSSAPKQTD